MIAMKGNGQIMYDRIVNQIGAGFDRVEITAAADAGTSFSPDAIEADISPSQLFSVSERILSNSTSSPKKAFPMTSSLYRISAAFSVFLNRY